MVHPFAKPLAIRADRYTSFPYEVTASSGLHLCRCPSAALRKVCERAIVLEGIRGEDDNIAEELLAQLELAQLGRAAN